MFAIKPYAYTTLMTLNRGQFKTGHTSVNLIGSPRFNKNMIGAASIWLVFLVLTEFSTYTKGAHFSNPNNPEGKTPKDYVLKECIVARDYSWVFRASPVHNTNHQQDCIVKVIDKRKLNAKPGRLERTEYEASSLAGVREHDHVVRLWHTMQDDIYAYLVTDYLPATTLDVVIDNKVIVAEDCVRFIIGELIMAIEHVHEIGYIHRDVKPENILLTTTGHVKLIDFGFAVPLGRHTEVVRSGTPLYAPAEYLSKNGEYGQSMDWFGMGMCMLQMVSAAGLIEPLAGSRIAELKRTNQLLENILANTMSPEGIDFVKLILSDCSKRPCYGKALREHEWFQGHTYGLQKESPISNLIEKYIRPTNVAIDYSQDFPMFHSSSTMTTRPMGRSINIPTKHTIQLKNY